MKHHHLCMLLLLLPVLVLVLVTVSPSHHTTAKATKRGASWAAIRGPQHLHSLHQNPISTLFPELQKRSLLSAEEHRTTPEGRCADRSTPQTCPDCSFCTARNGTSCCGSFLDRVVEYTYWKTRQEWETQGVQSSSKCTDFFQQFWCGFCDPAKGLTIAESGKLVVCQDFCAAYYCSCKDIFVEPGLKIRDFYTEAAWCRSYVQPFFEVDSSSPSCFSGVCPSQPQGRVFTQNPNIPGGVGSNDAPALVPSPSLLLLPLLLSCLLMIVM
mgnify:CR=1 FL=1